MLMQKARYFPETLVIKILEAGIVADGYVREKPMTFKTG